MSIALLVSQGMMFLAVNMSIFSMFFSGYFLKKLALKFLVKKSASKSEDNTLSDTSNASSDMIQKEYDRILTEENNFFPIKVRMYLTITLTMLYFYIGCTFFSSMGLSIDGIKAISLMGTTYWILLITAIVLLLAYLIIDLLIPALKMLFLVIKKMSKHDTTILQMKDLAKPLERNKFELICALVFSIGSVLIFTSSQILLWGFIVF